MLPALLAMKPALGLLRRFWWTIPILGLALALFITRSTLERRTGQLEATKAAYAQFVADVKAKTELARISDAANKARVERDQIQVTQEISSDYQNDLAALRRRYDERVRAAAAKANPGGSGIPAVPGVPGTAAGPDGSAPEAGLPLADALIASEQAVQLKALQEWVRGQAAVPREP